MQSLGILMNTTSRYHSSCVCHGQVDLDSPEIAVRFLWCIEFGYKNPTALFPTWLSFVQKYFAYVHHTAKSPETIMCTWCVWCCGARLEAKGAHICYQLIKQLCKIVTPRGFHWFHCFNFFLNCCRVIIRGISHLTRELLRGVKVCLKMQRKEMMKTPTACKIS